MGFLDSLKAWMKTEASELKDATDGLETRLDSNLTRREQQLKETPTEAMERLQGQIADSESSLGEIGDKIGAKQAKAEAVEELADLDRVDADPADDIDEDILDLPSEEIPADATVEDTDSSP